MYGDWQRSGDVDTTGGPLKIPITGSSSSEDGGDEEGGGKIEGKDDGPSAHDHRKVHMVSFCLI